MSVFAFLFLVVCGLALQAASGRFQETTGSVAGDYLESLATFTWVLVAAVITSRYPRHPVGWLLRSTALFWAFIMFATGWALYGYAGIGAQLPGRSLAALLVDWSSFAVSALLWTMIILVFPTGTFSSWRGRLVATVGVVVTVIVLTLGATRLALRAGALTINPLFVDWMDATTRSKVYVVAFTVLVVGLLLAAGSLLVRFRSSSGVERLQLKWFLFAASILVVGIAVTVVDLVVPLPDELWLFGHGRSGSLVVGGMISAIGDLAIGLAIGIAITRHRLYDIDRIINRTLVYGVVVAALAGVFVVGAVWIPTLLPTSNNSLAVAATTLAVFFLFQPLRRRVQHVVDRRFYRSRYDAQQVADHFAIQLRNEVTPRLVAEHWIEAVYLTMQPTTASIWIKEPDSTPPPPRP